MIPEWAENVSRETIDRLNRYAALIQKWNPTINLIGKTTEADLWNRHLWDSYQLVPIIPDGAHVADLGSGGGLPGIVLGCALTNPITLVERDIRKASFLREAVRALELSHVTVRNADATRISGPFDIVTSRALAALSDLCTLSAPILGAEGVCLFPKGEHYAKEVEEAGKYWTFKSRIIPSKTHDKACIVSLSELKRAG